LVTDSGVEQGEGASQTSLTLLARVRAHDEDAWGRLVSLYGPLVYGWCLRAGLQAADAADVGQEVFAAVARNIASFRRDQPGDSFRGWLYVITRSKISDNFAKRNAAAEGGSDAQRRLENVTIDDAPGSDDASSPEDIRLLHRRAIELVRGEFEPRTWQAVWRVAAQGERPADVARELGMSVNAVYLAKSHVKKRLREEFDALIDFGEVKASTSADQT
jgi:RNA polymerase sigma-70 factor, ECF subfamily